MGVPGVSFPNSGATLSRALRILWISLALDVGLALSRINLFSALGAKLLGA